MKTPFLLPNSFKIPGLILFVIGLLAGILYSWADDPWAEDVWYLDSFDTLVFALVDDPVLSDKKYFTWIDNNILDEIIATFLIVGGIMLAFSREKNEDEFIASLRMQSLLQATYANYVILIISVWLLFGLSFYWILIVNTFTLLLFFNIRYYWSLFRNRKAAQHEE